MRAFNVDEINGWGRFHPHFCEAFSREQDVSFFGAKIGQTANRVWQNVKQFNLETWGFDPW